MPDTGEFRLVTRRKKRTSNVRNKCHLNTPIPNDDNYGSDTDIYYETLFGKLLETEVELKSSLFADDFFHSLKDSLNALGIDGVPETLCYGLGSFSNDKSCRYQLALLLLLKDRYDSQIFIYDPIFSPKEIELLQRFGFNVININEDGKRVVEDNVTLVFMPHCPMYLTNNFLYANWTKNLKKCILLTNSFQALVDDFAQTEEPAIHYISRIQPYVTEIVLRNNFTYEEVFNELNIHIFLEQQISAIPQSFWNEREEPCYPEGMPS